MTTQPYYWEIQPATIKVSQNFDGISIPLVVRGQPQGGVNGLSFSSTNPDVAQVNDGQLVCGSTRGAAMLIVRDGGQGVRYVQVEVVESWGDGYQNGDDPGEYGL